jgi:hypothetical protein
MRYADARQRPRECHAWVNVLAGNFVIVACDTPQGQFAPNRTVLLSIAANFRPLRGSTPMRLELVQQRLADGSATFTTPQDWRINDLGKGCFVATDPNKQFLFMSAVVQVLTPKWAGNVRNVPVAPFMEPHKALRMLCIRQGFVDEMSFLEVNPRNDLAQQARGIIAGPIIIEDFLYSAVKGPLRTKGFSFGFTMSSQVGVNWTFWHMTVAGPQGKFDAFVPTFAGMMESFRVNERFAANYVRSGMQRVREMQRTTMEMCRRNAQEIPAMMQAAYDERQRSRDYQDYGWSQYIRGESDWISNVEGGTAYRSDTWGVTNRDTREFWEGKNWDYTHFRGQNPKYNELMQEVNSRDLYERYVKNNPRG